MGLFTRKAKLPPPPLEARGADPSQPWGDSTPPAPGSFTGPLQSILINDMTAMQVVTVQACVSILADAVATLPVYAYKRDPAGVQRRLDPVPQLLVRPYGPITRQDWITQAMVSLLLRGNAYGLVTKRDRQANATEVQMIAPDAVQVQWDPTSPGVKQYRIGGKVVDHTENIMHIMGISQPGSLEGMNPIQNARTSLALAKATEIYGAQFFQNSAEAAGIISIDGELTEDAAKAMVQSWIAAHQGLNKAHLPAVLTGGAKWTPIQINPDDAQFLQTRDFQRHDIAMLFRVPEHMLGIQDRTSSWGTGIEQMMIGFVIDTLRPWLSRLESALSDLLPNPNVEIKFDLSGRLRGDTEQRYTAYQVGLNNGILCVDEVRDKEDLPPLPDGQGQIYYQSVQAVPIGTSPAIPVPAAQIAPDAEV